MVARSKGRSGAGFFIIGVLLGPLGLLGSAVASPDKDKQDTRSKRAGLQSGAMRKCPVCAEVIQSEALKCRFCHSDVPPPPKLDFWGREVR